MKVTLLLISCSLTALAYGQDAKVAKLLSRFSETPQAPAPNYGITEHWAALPFRSDPADNTPRRLKDQQDSAAADVFFIHPTTYLGEPTDSFQWNADVRNAALNKEVDSRPIQFQASLFNAAGKIYAPRYRQAHYYAFLTPHKEDYAAALDLAYSDVKRAFEYFLEHYNQGRPIIIAGHSQGTIHAARLLRDYFGTTALQQQLVVAYLPGMPIPIDSLPQISPCKDSAQTGCYVSWRTFLQGYTPGWKTPDPARIVCHNPLSWRMDTVSIPSENNKGSVLYNFNRVIPHTCGAAVHQDYVWVSKPKFPGSNFYKSPNYHIADYNLFYMNIRNNAALRVEEYLRKGE
jgi:hypothetical protein